MLCHLMDHCKRNLFLPTNQSSFFAYSAIIISSIHPKEHTQNERCYRNRFFQRKPDIHGSRQSAADGIKKVHPNAEIAVFPLADGGEGTVEALTTGCGGIFTEVTVTGPLGKPVSCRYGILEESQTAIIEMSGAAGITLISAQERNPLATTTYGVGEVIRDAIGRGCRHFVVGIGGSATNDGGIGMLQALGFGFLDKNGDRSASVPPVSPTFVRSPMITFSRSFRNAPSALPVM